MGKGVTSVQAMAGSWACTKEYVYPSLTPPQKRISTGIILNSIPLATNPNGALLLTWLVDQSNLPGRYGLLANRFAPHIAHLCTHKLASLTVLRGEWFPIF